MNDIFHFVKRPYNTRSDHTLERKQDHTVYHGSESLFFLAPKLWDLLPDSIKDSTFFKEFKQKLILGHLTTVLLEYSKNLLGEQDSFKMFHRFCTFGVVMLLLDQLHVIFLNCTSFSDIFSRNQATCTLSNYQIFSILYIHVYIFKQVAEIFGSFMDFSFFFI